MNVVVIDREGAVFDGKDQHFDLIVIQAPNVTVKNVRVG